MASRTGRNAVHKGRRKIGSKKRRARNKRAKK